VQVISNAVGGMLFVDVLLLTAAPVTVIFVTVLAVERTLPEIAADVVHGAVVDTTLVTLQVTVPLETVIVARTGAVIVSETVPVEAADAPIGTISAAAASAVAPARTERRVA
jgi:hypothetical protein